MIDFCLSPPFSLSYKMIGLVSVYKSVTMATEAAPKHVHTQLSPLLRHLGLCALPLVPKHTYSFFYLQTHTFTHIVRMLWEV